MIKHFDVYPVGFDKNNLFDEQKIFLIYLIGVIPSIEDWTIQVEYKLELKNIQEIKSVEISESDIDIAKLHGENINELKKERLLLHKEEKIKELNKKYGIKISEETEKIKEIPESKLNRAQIRQDKIWEYLQGKELVIKDGQ